jgi:hypothetical protein
MRMLLLLAVVLSFGACSTTKSVVKPNTKSNCVVKTNVHFEGSY